MIKSIRPEIKLLSEELINKILDETYYILEKKGVFLENEEAIKLLYNSGAKIDFSSKRAFISPQLVEKALSSAPSEIIIYDSYEKNSYIIGGNNVHFNPGSTAITIFDHKTQSQRKPITLDLIKFSRLTQKLEHFHFQSTALISSDVPEEIADCYRLYISFQYCSKPIVTGTFLIEGFRPMYEMLIAIRGSAENLKEKPLAIFDVCPSSPLKWSNLTAQTLIDCARANIPLELVSMSLTGATSPVTLSGALVQHMVENLSGLVISQIANPGTPVIFGGSPSSFDMRTGTTPMGAIETMMLDSAYAQIGKRLNLPTHAYMGLSDAKCIDTQAGLESGIGTILAALSGINVVSGGGMMDFESCQSLEKLIIDDEICGIAYRLIEGIIQRDEPIAIDLLSEIKENSSFLTHPHTRKWYRVEHTFPKILDRGNYGQWVNSGKKTLSERASEYIKELLSQKDEPMLSDETKKEFRKIMKTYARSFGIERLPEIKES
ncbi:trimethylamine methyltransferase family protein [Candidatus Aminicenantes bacterium AH-873-B07]|nr:trimethylamine methyltransferase family protein [Candidatus Aminicenantes bacterium AH-873-B07]